MLELNKIYNQDCLEGLKLIDDKSIDLVVTDPPYLYDGSGGGGAFGSKKEKYHNELNDIKNDFNREILDELCRVMKKINIYIFCSHHQIISYLDYFVKGLGCNWNLLTWHKTNPIPTCNNKYVSDTEYCLFFRSGGVKIYGSFDTKRTYYVTPLNVADKKLYGHPTIKPMQIIKNLITNSSQEGQIVLDPFIGSGTTAVAAQQLGRQYIGFELNQTYYETACNRIKEEQAQLTLF